MSRNFCLKFAVVLGMAISAGASFAQHKPSQDKEDNAPAKSSEKRELIDPSLYSKIKSEDMYANKDNISVWPQLTFKNDLIVNLKQSITTDFILAFENGELKQMGQAGLADLPFPKCRAYSHAHEIQKVNKDSDLIDPTSLKPYKEEKREIRKITSLKFPRIQNNKGSWNWITLGPVSSSPPKQFKGAHFYIQGEAVLENGHVIPVQYSFTCETDPASINPDKPYPTVQNLADVLKSVGTLELYKYTK